METGPLALGEALALCYSNQHLLGAPLNDQYCVDLVIVAPYGAREQALYVQGLLNDEVDIMHRPPVAANSGYDVVVVAFVVSGAVKIILRRLRSYLAEIAPLYGIAEHELPPVNVLTGYERTLYFN